MRQFFSLFRRWSNARPNYHLVDYLVNNQLFRKLAVTFHNRKTNIFEKLDEKLE